MSRSQALAQRRRQRPTWRRDRPTWSAISGLLKPSKAQRMMEARCRNCDEAVGALETVRRMSCCRSVMMILAVLPGMVRDLLMHGDLAKPGNFSRTVNLLVAQLRLVGLVKFDIPIEQDPEVSGIEYRQGTLAGDELREYLLEKFDRMCAYWGKTDVPLQVEHLGPK